MKCQKCSHEQSVGKFCGKCGNPLLAAAENSEKRNFQQSFEKSATAANQPINPFHQEVAALPYSSGAQAQPIEKAKEVSKHYWIYFLHHMKKPTSIFESSTKNLTNALITIAIFIVLVSLLVQNMIGYTVQLINKINVPSLFSEALIIPSPTFFEVIPSMLLYLGILFALSFASLYLVSKYMGPQLYFKQLIAVIGTLLIPAILILAAAYLSLFIGIRELGNGLFFIGLVSSFLVIPLYAITMFNKQEPRKHDSLFASIAYTSLFLIGSSICFSWMIKSRINEVLSTVKELLSVFL